MNYSCIKLNDISNGPGIRTSLFVSGCRHKCKNCFNQNAWNFNSGNKFDKGMEDYIIHSLDSHYISGVSILGGEPMEPENQQGVLNLIKRIREAYHDQKTIWVYTGSVYEDLLKEDNPYHTEYTEEILDTIDILVDGPFIEELHDISLVYKGSSNQRILNMKLMRK